MHRKSLWLPIALLAATVALAAAPASNRARTSRPSKHPIVEIVTSQGSITVELWPEVAPQTVRNFIGYAMDGYYNGTVFHRVIPGFMIQGGGYTADLKGKGGLKDPIPLEANAPNKKYTIAMARTADPNSATSQFFINVEDNQDTLDAGRTGRGYAVFGQVIRGKQVVSQISKTPTKEVDPAFKNVPVTPVKIEKVVVNP